MLEGLTSREAEEKLRVFGFNKIEAKKKSFLKKLISWILSPVSFMLLAAAFLSLYIGRTADFFIILFLFLSNFFINIWHEGKTDKSIEKLQQNLEWRVRAFRDGMWKFVESYLLVPGDVVQLKIGSIIPADISISQAENLFVDESTLTGESFPKEKKAGDTVYSGSFVSTGDLVGIVTATGKKTYFGKTITSVDKRSRRSALEKDILSISKFISVVSLFVVAILTFVLFLVKTPWSEIMVLDLSLMIAGIPIALPTVMSLIISIGVLELARKKAVVRRLASLEELANVNLFLTDKTGTLTENRIQVEKILPFGKYSKEEIIKLSLSATSDPELNPLDKALFEARQGFSTEEYTREEFIPGDSERKRSTAVISIQNKFRTVSLGAPQVVESLCRFSKGMKDFFDKTVSSAASSGYRVLALAVSHGREEKNMELAGMFFLSDRLRKDALKTLHFMKKNGIDIKILTGDNFEISNRIAKALGLKGKMYKRDAIEERKENLEDIFSSATGFSEILPKDKSEVVRFAEKHYTVAVTGDGVNDLPAVESADVGFAVANAVDALKSGADIVLLSEGISVIKNAIVEARKIFYRLYNYSVYRISESFRIVITIAIIGFFFKTYPLTPVQLILLALLNDLPIVSLAFDRVKNSLKPTHINAKERFTLSSLFGFVGVANSLIFLYAGLFVLHLSWEQIQTMFFLKLTISGHMLIYVAHTEKRWYQFLPSWQVILATTGTQLIATALAFWGLFVTHISLGLIIFVWIWAFFWMQISDLMKWVQTKIYTPHIM